MTAVEKASAPMDQVWNKVCSTLRGEVGEQAYGSYLAHASLRRSADGAPVLVTPTGYARDWVRRNAMRRLGEVWSQHDPEQRRLELMSKLEFEAECMGVETVAAEPAPVAAEPLEVRAPSGLRGLCLQERLTFDSFVEGAANRFAYDTARRVAAWEPGFFNPVLIHGPWGLGKTHLLTAMAWEAQRAAPTKTVIYLTAERFLNGFLKAIQDRSTSAFKEELRAADLLLIDDVHFVGNKPATQEELFHTLTWLVEEGRRVVLSADRAPAELTEVEARLRSHLAAGLVCGIQPAERALRMAVVERRLEILARAQGVAGTVKLEVLQFLADRFTDSVRELEGATNTVFAQSADRLAKLSVDECSMIIRPHLKGTERRVTVDEIQKTVAAHYALKQEDLLSERRARAVARPRQVAMYLAKTMTTRSYPDIGRRFGGRDHTTVLHGVRVIEKLLATDDQMARDVEALTRTLRG
jgi:chromosomal replication initiator protein